MQLLIIRFPFKMTVLDHLSSPILNFKMIFRRINIYQTEISYNIYVTANSRNMTNSGTASQILKHSTKILKKGLAWSDSDACYCSSSQTSKLQQNMRCVTITFPHQNISRNQGLYSSTVQQINTCTKKGN